MKHALKTIALTAAAAATAAFATIIMLQTPANAGGNSNVKTFKGVKLYRSSQVSMRTNVLVSRPLYKLVEVRKGKVVRPNERSLAIEYCAGQNMDFHGYSINKIQTAENEQPRRIRKSKSGLKTIEKHIYAVQVNNAFIYNKISCVNPVYGVQPVKQPNHFVQKH